MLLRDQLHKLVLQGLFKCRQPGLLSQSCSLIVNWVIFSFEQDRKPRSREWGKQEQVDLTLQVWKTA